MANYPDNYKYIYPYKNIEEKSDVNELEEVGKEFSNKIIDNDL